MGFKDCDNRPSLKSQVIMVLMRVPEMPVEHWKGYSEGEQHHKHIPQKKDIDNFLITWLFEFVLAIIHQKLRVFTSVYHKHVNFTRVTHYSPSRDELW